MIKNVETKRGGKYMKKTLPITIVFILICAMSIIILPNYIYATDNVTTDGVIDNETESQLLEIKESQAETLDEYIDKYGSETYGFTAYILHLVQLYSIPFCFLGIVISVIYKVVLGVRHIESAEKGLGAIIAVVTITIICQVLPLVFALVVKLGKE